MLFFAVLHVDGAVVDICTAPAFLPDLSTFFFVFFPIFSSGSVYLLLFLYFYAAGMTVHLVALYFVQRERGGSAPGPPNVFDTTSSWTPCMRVRSSYDRVFEFFLRKRCRGPLVRSREASASAEDFKLDFSLAGSRGFLLEKEATAPVPAQLPREGE